MIEKIKLENHIKLDLFQLKSKIIPGVLVKILLKNSRRLVGIVLAIRNKDISKTIRLRNVINLFGVEIIFPINSPKAKYLLKKKQKKQFNYIKSKLYYLIKKTADKTKVKFQYYATT